MKRTYVGVVVAMVLTAACPYDSGLVPGGTIGFGTGGGSGNRRLVFSVQPSLATHGQIIVPAIQVAVEDTLGNPDSTFRSGVTVSLAANPGGGTLSGTLTVTPANAVALFGDLRISVGSSGYILQASAPGATTIISASFNIQ
jgi:hypothetical protein